jgi:hypothetical protein
VARFNSEQLKNFAAFFNTMAAAWLSAATVSPFFDSGGVPGRVFVLTGSGILLSLWFLLVSNRILKDL